MEAKSATGSSSDLSHRPNRYREAIRVYHRGPGSFERLEESLNFLNEACQGNRLNSKENASRCLSQPKGLQRQLGEKP